MRELDVYVAKQVVNLVACARSGDGRGPGDD